MHIASYDEVLLVLLMLGDTSSWSRDLQWPIAAIPLPSHVFPPPRGTGCRSYPRNCAPDGPTSMSRLARPSPSTMGGMVASRCRFTRRQVTRVGALHLRGGMIMRRPFWRHPRMAPPLASTMKLTRKLRRKGGAGTDANVSNGLSRKGGAPCFSRKRVGRQHGAVCKFTLSSLLT